MHSCAYTYREMQTTRLGSIFRSLFYSAVYPAFLLNYHQLVVLAKDFKFAELQPDERCDLLGSTQHSLLRDVFLDSVVATYAPDAVPFCNRLLARQVNLYLLSRAVEMYVYIYAFVRRNALTLMVFGFSVDS